jgi:hypothetical protein
VEAITANKAQPNIAAEIMSTRQFGRQDRQAGPERRHSG